MGQRKSSPPEPQHIGVASGRHSGGTGHPASWQDALRSFEQDSASRGAAVGAQAVARAGRKPNGSQLACRLAVRWETNREDPLPWQDSQIFSSNSALSAGSRPGKEPEDWGWETSRELRVGQPSS